MVEEKPLRASEVAQQLGINKDTVRRWLREKKMKGRYIGGQIGYLVMPADVRAFLEENGNGEK
jgi:excisionase family DNA binding protein